LDGPPLVRPGIQDDFDAHKALLKVYVDEQVYRFTGGQTGPCHSPTG
jgi:hypothetical protein